MTAPGTQITRKCSDCDQAKPLEQFNRNRSRAAGREYICRDCKHARDQRYRQANPGKGNLRSQRWNAANRDRRRTIMRRYNETHREARRDQDRSRYVGHRDTVADHYGRTCACCGSTDRLTIDHVNGDGRERRLVIGPGRLYRWLVRNGLPAGFQTLCFPCNRSKGSGESCRLDHVGTQVREARAGW
jgi:hypothetical protein